MSRAGRLAVAAFVSPHGFGHAARASAVLAALRDLRPGLGVELVTTVPEWFFADSLDGRGELPAFGYHPVVTDVGLVQRTPLEEDLDATAERLREFLPPDPRQVAALAATLEGRGVGAVLCDISPLGIAVALELGVPSILLESFTWDWIYRRYPGAPAALLAAAERLEALYGFADRRLQARPFCAPRPGGLRLPPIARRSRRPPEAVRRDLGVPADAALVLLTMGGVTWRWPSLPAPGTTVDGREIWLVAPGEAEAASTDGKVVRLPHRSGFHHPDLVRAADAVVGKLGYSTVAELWSAGVPFGYLTRPRFPESPILEVWVDRQLPSRRLELAAVESGRFVAELPALLALPRDGGPRGDGAARAAEEVLKLLDRR